MTTSRIGRALRSLMTGLAMWRGRFFADYADEEPDRPVPRTLHAVGEDGHLWFAVFGCPCGCGETIKLSLLPTGSPRWQMTDHWDGTVSLRPSIWRQRGCKSHFWLKRGKIHWC